MDNVLELLEYLRKHGVIKFKSYDEDEVTRFFKYHSDYTGELDMKEQDFSNMRDTLETVTVGVLTTSGVYELVSVEQEVKALVEHVGGKTTIPGDFNSFYVCRDKGADGAEYLEVWGNPQQYPSLEANTFRFM